MVALLRNTRMGNPVLCCYDDLLAFVIFGATSLLQHRLNWRFYLDPKIHAAALLAFSFAISLLGGCYWGFRMWKFYESKRKIGG